MPISSNARIHPTAIIDPQADIEDDVQIGSFVVIEGPVKIGSGTIVHERVSLHGPLSIGIDNQIGIGSVIGTRPQHLGYKGGDLGTVIGDGNIIREYITIHRAYLTGAQTKVGNHNFLMVGSHIGHDSVVGNHCILANGCMLGGHAEMQDRSFLSGNAGVHQFNRIGRLAIVSGLSVVTRDLPPFMMAYDRNHVIGLNIVGMKRAGMTREELRIVSKAFHILFRGESIQSLTLDRLKSEMGSEPLVQEILHFYQTSRRGCMRPLRVKKKNETLDDVD